MPGELISSDMPGTEQFQGMSEEELGKQLPVQGSLPGTESNPAQAQPKADQGAGAAGEQGAVQSQAQAQATEPKPQDSTKALEAKLEAVMQQLSRMSRETRGYQALQHKLDRLESALAQRGAPAPTTLTPEQQAQAQAQEAEKRRAEEFLNDWLGKQMEARYGSLIEPLRQQQFFTGIQSRCSEMGFDLKALDPIFGKLIKDDMALEREGDPAAKARLDRILQTGDPTELILRGVAEQGKALAATGARVQQAQEAAADKGGRAVKANGAKPEPQTGKLTLEKVEAMTEEEREKLSEEELKGLLPQQRRR